MTYIREAVDKKQENMRRRRRRDALRLQLVKVLKLIAENGTFGVSPCVLERDTMSLHPTFVDYMDGARMYLEADIDKDNTSMREVKVHFCDFIRIMIKNFSRKSAFSSTAHSQRDFNEILLPFFVRQQSKFVIRFYRVI